MAIFEKKQKKNIFGKKKSGGDKDQKTGVLKDSLKVVTGVVTGAVAGLLFAPKSGKETRKDIKDGANNLGNQISDKSKELGKATKDQFNNVKDTIKDKTKK